jgi:hypothetical protein
MYLELFIALGEQGIQSLAQVGFAVVYRHPYSYQFFWVGHNFNIRFVLRSAALQDLTCAQHLDKTQ